MFMSNYQYNHYNIKSTYKKLSQLILKNLRRLIQYYKLNNRNIRPQNYDRDFSLLGELIPQRSNTR